MRITIIVSTIIFLLLASCKKVSTDQYAGDFYIRVPVTEDAHTYFVPGSYFDDLYIVFDGADKKRWWKIIPLGDQKYNIAAGDSSSQLITDLGAAASVAKRDSSHPDNQIFKIVPSGVAGSVSFQSAASGKLLQLAYCFKGTETWGYKTPMNDPAVCTAYQIINLSAQADTCYCVDRFILERN